MNWAFLILTGLIAILSIVEKYWDYLLKHWFGDGRTNDHKKLRKRLALLTIALFVANTIVVVVENHRKAEKAVKFENEIHSLTNQLVKISDQNLKLRDTISQGFRDISHQFSTNTAIPPAIRLAILDDALAKVQEKRTVLQKNHELFNASATDMETLRAERNNELDLQENQKRQAAIQQEVYELESRENVAEALKYQQLKEQGLLKSKKILADQILPVFEYVVSGLGRKLDDISKQTREKIFSNIPGETPSVYASDLVKDGIIINGTNFICVGTNSAWNFIISTTVAPLQTSLLAFQDYPSFLGFDNKIVFHEPFVSIYVVCQTPKGESVLTVTPYRDWQPDMPASPPPETPPVAGRLFYPQISIKLQVPNGLNIDERQPSTNCASAIDKALRRLIEAQDQQFPLGTKRQP
jgi:hypothetical protein